MARKNKKTKSDWHRQKTIEKENVKLKKEVTKLRSLVKDTYSDSIQDRVDRCDKGERPVLPVCEICGNEDLHSVPIKRADGEWEIRLCKSCGHRGQLRKINKPKDK